MAIEAVCGSCGRRYQAPDVMAGKRVKCKQCGGIFTLPLPELSDDPDLESLADLEQTHAPYSGGPRSVAPGSSRTGWNLSESQIQPDHPEESEEESEELTDDTEEEPLGRRNVRFRYKYSKMLDAWLAPVLVLLGIAWASLAIARAEEVPDWLKATRIGLMVLFYGLVIVPLTLTSLRMAGRAMRYQLPSNALWRTFASYMPAFTLALVMWNVGGGAGIALFLGLLLGLGISAASLWALFRLQPQEIAPSAGYGTGGFMVGTVVTGLIMFGLNMLIVRTYIESKKEPPMPASPFGQAFAWVPKTEQPVAPSRSPSQASINLKSGQPVVPVIPSKPEQPTPPVAVTPGPTPTPVTPGPVAVTPPDATGELFPDVKTPPVENPGAAPANVDTAPLTITKHPPTVRVPNAVTPASPLVARIDVVPLDGSFDAVLRPAVKSAFAAIIRPVDGNNLPIEVWDTDPYKKKGATTFSNSGGTQDVNFVLSPDGVHLARVAVFPKPSVQIWSFPESRVDRSIDIADPPNAFELLGFVTDSRLIARVDTQTTSIRWIDINSKKAKAIDLGVLLPRGAASVAINPAGTQFAVALKFSNEPVIAVYTLESGIVARRIKMTEIGPNMNIAPTGMAFSPDGTQISAIIEHDGGGALIVTYLVSTGKPVGEAKVYPASPVATRTTPFVGSSLAWFPDGKAWLLYGDVLIDAASGRPLGRLNVPNVVTQRIPSADTVELTTQDPAQHERQMLRVRLDTTKIAAEPAK